MKRPNRKNYPNGVFGDISYDERLERYCSYLQNQLKQLRIGNVGNHVFCPHCGDKRQLKVETDLNSGRVCKSRLCKGK